jgi:ferric-dicitrate binding protein FerR (iron transport regulator)
LEDNNEHIDILIAKVAMGEADPQEVQQLSDWETLSEENRLYVAQSKKVLGAMPFVEVDTNAAWAKVKHNEEKPFVVSVNDVFVKDIGTGFNVKADDATNTVTVVVETGVVDFYTTNNKGLTLKAGETGMYNGNTKAFTKQENEANPNALSYKTKLFNFKRTTLATAIAQLNNVYDSNIVLENDNLKNCLITVDFNNEDLDTIIDIITATLNLKSKKEGGKIILYGDGC